MTEPEPEIHPVLLALQARMRPWDRAALLAAGLALTYADPTWSDCDFRQLLEDQPGCPRHPDKMGSLHLCQLIVEMPSHSKVVSTG